MAGGYSRRILNRTVSGLRGRPGGTVVGNSKAELVSGKSGRLSLFKLRSTCPLVSLPLRTSHRLQHGVFEKASKRTRWLQRTAEQVQRRNGTHAPNRRGWRRNLLSTAGRCAPSG